MLRECENSGHDGGTSHRGMGSWDPQVITDSATQPPGNLSPRVPQQLPMLPVPDHLSVLPATARDLHNRAHLIDAGIFLPGVRL